VTELNSLIGASAEAPGARPDLLARAGAPSGDSAAREARASAGAAFAELLEGAVQQANRDQIAAERAARDLAEGKGDVVDAMLATSHADVSLRFVVTLRNRILDAYQEIMRLQV